MRDDFKILSPDKVEISLSLAGLGSRAVASFLDSLIKNTVVLILFLLTTLADASLRIFNENVRSNWIVAIFIIVIVLLIGGYGVFFETFWNGQTPGKKILKIKVVLDNGQPAGFLPITLRNLMRLIDYLPINYLVGILSILLSGRNQRLGDMVAGTLVVRTNVISFPSNEKYEFDVPRSIKEVAWSLPIKELDMIKSFLARQKTMAADKSAQLGHLLAARVAEVLMLPKDDTTDYLLFLKQVVAGYGLGPREIEEETKEEEKKDRL